MFIGTPYASSSDQGPASINVGEVTKETEQTNEKSAEPVCRDNDDHHQSNPENITCKVPHPSRTLYYPSLDKCITLETDLQVGRICNFHEYKIILVFI